MGNQEIKTPQKSIWGLYHRKQNLLEAQMSLVKGIYYSKQPVRKSKLLTMLEVVYKHTPLCVIGSVFSLFSRNRVWCKPFGKDDHLNTDQYVPPILSYY